MNRIEFKIIEENKQNQEILKYNELNKVTEIQDSILNYNRLNPKLNFDNFIQGKSNDIACRILKKSAKIFLDTIHYTYVVVLVWEKLTT